jgi:dihydroorotase
MNILFTDIRIVNPYQSIDTTGNLWLKDGLIQKISRDNFECDEETQIIPSIDLIASPGFFDMHVHFREPGFEQKEDIATGVESAANGGFTGVVVMPNTKPPIHDCSVVEYIQKKSENLLVDIHISACITQDMDGINLTEMKKLADSGVIMFTDDGKCVTNSKTMRNAFDTVASEDYLIAQHCEDTDLTGQFDMNESEFSLKFGLNGYPRVAEEIILFRDILLAEYCGNRRYHAQHISTENSVEIIRLAKKKGLRVTCEVTPHHFSLAEHLLCDHNTNLKMNPPLRADSDILAIKNGLKDGTIDAIATDHAPHTLNEKEVEFNKAPNGILGLETALGVSVKFLVEEGFMSISELIEKFAINPRTILGLGQVLIQEGERANLTIFNPDEEWIVDVRKFKSKSKNSPYDKMQLKGKVKYTINNNKIYYCDL